MAQKPLNAGGGPARKFLVRVPDHELEDWRRRAAEAGLTVSEWLRRQASGDRDGRQEEASLAS